MNKYKIGDIIKFQDIDYNRKFKFPENIKKSLSLDKE